MTLLSWLKLHSWVGLEGTGLRSVAEHLCLWALHSEQEQKGWASVPPMALPLPTLPWQVLSTCQPQDLGICHLWHWSRVSITGVRGCLHLLWVCHVLALRTTACTARVRLRPEERHEHLLVFIQPSVRSLSKFGINCDESTSDR